MKKIFIINSINEIYRVITKPQIINAYPVEKNDLVANKLYFTLAKFILQLA